MNCSPLYVLIAVLLASCLHGDTPAEVDAEATKARNEINGIAEQLNALAPAIAVGCKFRDHDDRIARACSLVDSAWPVAKAAIHAAHDATDVYYASGQALSAVYGARDRALDAVRTIREAVEAIASAATPHVDAPPALAAPDAGT